MYKAKFVSDAGREFIFSYENGVIFDISELSGVSVSLSTSQGFGQYGETIEGKSVAGFQRTINGKFLNNREYNKRNMLAVFAPLTDGKLYFNDEYYCECSVAETPLLGVSEPSFFITLYCAYPFWLKSTESNFALGGYTPAFRFPVNYSQPHRFGIKNPTAYVNCVNNGVVDAPYSVRFTADATVENYGIVNPVTLKFLKINDTIEIGEEVNVYRKNGKLYVEKNKDRVTSSIFAKLDEDTDLFYMAVGDNPINAIADSGKDNLKVSIVFNDSFSGVYDGM